MASYIRSGVGGIINTVSPYLSSVPQITSIVDSEVKKEKLVHLSEHNFEDFADLLNLNDKIAQELSDGFTSEDLRKYELVPPRVIVVGLTSAGKSSLLERIIGHSIFPVRDTVCTRRPFRVQLKKDSTAVETILRFSHIDRDYKLPDDILDIRKVIETEQKSIGDDVEFSSKEICAEIRSANKETFTFTDLPGIFLVSEKKMGKDYASSRVENEKLKKLTQDLTRKYINQPNTIVLLVISSTDWLHSMNNDNLIADLAEWLEEARKDHEVPVYGVITKLDTQTEQGLATGSPIRRIFMNQLPKDHILRGLKVNKWIPVISSPAILAQGSGPKASEMEKEAVQNCLRKSLPPSILSALPIGRTQLLKELKGALLLAIGQTHGRMRQSLDLLLLEIENNLKHLPQPATPAEKRRLFDQRLKILETVLNNLVGARGHDDPLSSTDESKKTLRMQLMVDAPAQFEKDLNETKLRGNMQAEVKQILNQAALEAGGSFDSDVTFQSLSIKIIQRFTLPCLRMVHKCASIIRQAIQQSTDKAFSDYKQLNLLVLDELGVPSEELVESPLVSDSKESSSSSSSSSNELDPSLESLLPITTNTSSTSSTTSLPTATSSTTHQFYSEPSDIFYHSIHTEKQIDPNRLFGYLTNSATAKVLNLLDAFQTMTCFHPMWRYFDLLHQNILLREADESDKKEGKKKNPMDLRMSPENTLQEILNLPELAKVVRQEGDLAIETYEKQNKVTLSTVNRAKIAKHFARVEVMGYIIRTSLMSSVFPLVLRDLRDGLFRGVKFGIQSYEHSVSTLLRQKLVFEPENEKKVFQLMEPSSEDVEKRDNLTKKKNTLTSLKIEFLACQDKQRKLVELLRSS